MLCITLSPDWIQAIAAIGTLVLAGIAICQTKRSNRQQRDIYESEKKIDKLAGVVDGLKEIVEPLAKSAVEMKAQTDILTKAHALNQKLNIQHLIPMFGGVHISKSSPYEFFLTVINAGLIANHIEFTTSDNGYKFGDQITSTLQTNHSLPVLLTVENQKLKSEDLTFQFQIHYRDTVGRQYVQVCGVKFGHMKFDSPILFKSHNEIIDPKIRELYQDFGEESDPANKFIS